MNSLPAPPQGSPRLSPWLIGLFAFYNRHYLRRHFNSVRVLKKGLPEGNRPNVIFLNHASWWDPLVSLFVSSEFFHGCASFAPMDARMLLRYRLFKYLGFFGIEPHCTRGAFAFIRTADSILK